MSEPHGRVNKADLSLHAVEVLHDPDLIAVLDGLGVRWTTARPSNGARGTIKVANDHHVDHRLEQLIGLLSDLRWQYTPGRTLQLELPLPGYNDGPH